VIGVFAEFAVNVIENCVHVDCVLVVLTANIWLEPPAVAVIDTGGPPQRVVYDPR
jgi:hypothetical protein